MREQSLRSTLMLLVCAVLITYDARPAYTQAPPSGLEIVQVPLAAWIASRQHAHPETLPDFEVDRVRRERFLAMTRALVQGDWDTAKEKSGAPLSYLIVALREDNNWFVIASDNRGAGRDPTFVLNLAPKREVIFHAPHMSLEQGTGEQAVILLNKVGGRAAIVSGAHRCASRTFTSCDGRTSVCGTLEAYRTSDVSHNPNTLFHDTHVLTADAWRSATVVSLHGMREDRDGVRTSLILSDGTYANDVEQRTIAARLRSKLENALGPPGTVVSCNIPADDKYRYRKLCGFTNVQGRHLNRSPNVCSTSVSEGTGRFVHLEQDWEILAPYARGWANIEAHKAHSAIRQALESALPASPDLQRPE